MLLDDDGDDQWLLGAEETEGEGEQGDEQDEGELATSASASGPGVSAGSSSDEEGHFLDLGVDTDPLAHAVVEDGDTTGKRKGRMKHLVLIAVAAVVTV